MTMAFSRAGRGLCTLVGLALALGGASRGLADSDPLAEAAKKEQERRQKLKKAGAVERTFTEEDLAHTKGKLANEPTGGTPGDATPVGGKKLADPERPDTKEQYWRTRAAAARARVEGAQRRRDALQRMIIIGQPARYDANGQRVIYSSQQMKEKADAADAALATAQADLEKLLDEGRHAGALPGWLR